MNPLIETFPKQTKFAETVLSAAIADDPAYRYFLYGGAIRGGKTVVCLALVFALCKMFPGSRWVFTRKDLPTIRRNLWPAFNKFKPDFVGRINKSTKVSECANGSQIIFMPESIKDDPEGDRFRGLEVNGFVNEEVHEIQEATFNRQMERAGTWQLDKQPSPLIMNTCNPAQGWVKTKWYNPWKTDTLEAPYYYLPAKADDNPHVPEQLKQAWKELPEKEYKRFVEGDWDVADDPDQLIKFEWVHNAYETEEVGGRQRMGVDVARFGDDSTVFAYMTGNTLTDIEEHDGLSIDRTASIVAQRMQDRSIGADQVGVDTVGLGAGVADNLAADGYAVKEIVSGAKPVEWIEQDGKQLYEAFGFKNLRSQMWWHAREQLRTGKLRMDVREQKLVDDLLAPRYKISADKVIEVESKDDIKKRLGRSTDFGDGFVYAAFVEHVEDKAFEVIEI